MVALSSFGLSLDVRIALLLRESHELLWMRDDHSWK